MTITQVITEGGHLCQEGTAWSHAVLDKILDLYDLHVNANAS